MDRPSSLARRMPALTLSTVVEVVGSEVQVEGAVFEHMVGGGKHGSGDRSDGFPRAASRADAQVLGLQVASFGARGRPGALDEGGL